MEKKNIYQKLLTIQKAVKGLSKDKKSHNYDYVSGNKLLSFIKPLMDEQGLILKQEILSIDNERQNYQVWDKWAENAKGTKGDWKPKSEILSKVMMRFTWVDVASQEKDENLFGSNGQNDWDKGVGSALTYGERYFLLKFFHVATDEDDIDGLVREESAPTPIKQPIEQPVEQPTIFLTERQFTAAINSDKKGIEATLKTYSTPFKQMTKEQKEQLETKLKTL